VLQGDVSILNLKEKGIQNTRRKNHWVISSKCVLGADDKILKAGFLNISGTWLAAHSVLCFSLFP